MSDWCHSGSEVELEDVTNAKKRAPGWLEDFPNNHPIIVVIVSFHNSNINMFLTEATKKMELKIKC